MARTIHSSSDLCFSIRDYSIYPGPEKPGSPAPALFKLALEDGGFVKTETWTKANPLSRADEQAWDAYGAGHADGAVFHAMRWQRVLDQAYGRPHHHIAVKDKDGIRGIL